MKLKSLSNAILLLNTERFVREEREMTLRVLHHLAEIERRRLYAEEAYPSLFAFCTERLGYSASAACRRISAMRLLRELPEVEEKIESGLLTLDVASKTQSFCRKEEIRTKEEKLALLNTLQGKSSREVEKELAARCSEPETPKERVRAVGDKLTELRICLDDDAMADLELLRNRLSQKSLGEILKLCLKNMVKVTDPARERRARKSPPAPVVNRRVGAKVRREVFKRDGERCTFCDPKTGKRCESRHQLEIDHKIPYSLGGKTELSNLRVLCKTHNVLHAVHTVGPEMMQKYVKI